MAWAGSCEGGGRCSTARPQQDGAADELGQARDLLLACVLALNRGGHSRKAAVEVGAASAARGMCRRLRRIAERVADLAHVCCCKPSIADASLDCPAISGCLAAADVVMAALVVEDEKLHGVVEAAHPRRIEDKQPRLRHSNAEVGKVHVELGSHIPATYAASSD